LLSRLADHERQRGLEDVTSIAVRAEISCLLLALLSVTQHIFSATLGSLPGFAFHLVPDLKITGGGDLKWPKI
jgi:hypothetical protein